MKQCSICLENKLPSLNKNFKCNCSMFICNKCSKKLKESDSIYVKCPQCRNEKSTIKEKYININCINIDTFIAIILWFLFLNLLGHYIINLYLFIYNDKFIEFHIEKINKYILIFIIEPLIGLLTLLFIFSYLACCISINNI